MSSSFATSSDGDIPVALKVVVSFMIGVIGACILTACILAFWHYQESRTAAGGRNAGAREGPRSPAAPPARRPSSSHLSQFPSADNRVPSTSTAPAKRSTITNSPTAVSTGAADDAATATAINSGGSGLGASIIRRRGLLGTPPTSGAGALRSGGSCTTQPTAASSDILDAYSSMYDTQETMDSAMVQEILGSVDAHTIRETQVLLSSFNWDLEELLHQEMGNQGRS